MSKIVIKRLKLSPDWAEFIAVLFIVWLPAVLPDGQPASATMRHAELYSQWGFAREIIRSFGGGFLAAFFLWSKPADPSFLSLVSSRVSPARQIAAGVGLWFAYYLFFDFWGLLSSVLHMRSGYAPWFQPQTQVEVMQNTFFSVVNGVSEEIIRVYLLSQCAKLGGGNKKGIVSCAFLIAAYHSYQGSFTAVGFFAVNLVINAFYLRHRSLLALFVWHVMSDCMHSTDLPGWGIVSTLASGAVMDVLSWLGLVAW